MSKNITIQEGGVAKQLTVDKLKTNLVGGGTQLWVPEDSVEQTTKSITANGTYKASDDGYYGYSEVTVNVPGGAGGPPGGRGSSIVGKDGDGDDAIVTVDPETGELEEEKLPNHIHVVTPPYNPRGIYADGETIDVGPDSGFEVVAVLADNSLYEAPGYPMGHIPLSELTVEPTVAEYDESTDSGHVDGSGVDHSPMIYPDADYDIYTARVSSMKAYVENAVWKGYTLDFSEPVFLTFVSRSNTVRNMVFYSQSPFSCTQDQIQGESKPTTTHSSTIERGGITYYYYVYILSSSGGVSTDYDNVGVSTVDGDGISGVNWDVAYLIFNGSFTAGSRQTINVSWPRPGDGQVLETTFEIRVAPSPSGDDDN